MHASPQGTTLSSALALSETGFVFDPRTGHSYNVNPSGLFVLKALKERCSLTEIVRQIEAGFEGARGVEQDVIEFVDSLGELGLLGREDNSQ